MCVHLTKNLIGFFTLMTLVSCFDKKQEFISLDHMTFTNSYYKNDVKISFYVLIANPIADEIELKNSIAKYVNGRLGSNKFMKDTKVHSLNFVFYKKTANTSYFTENIESHDALNTNEISRYKDDYIANYYVVKCDGGFTNKLYLFDRGEQVISNSCK